MQIGYRFNYVKYNFLIWLKSLSCVYCYYNHGQLQVGLGLLHGSSGSLGHISSH